MSVLPETGYFQGMPKMFRRKLQLDFPFPEFAQLGEQPVLNEELMYQNSAGVDAGTFGYQSRYAEYKYIPSTVTGEMRLQMLGWHDFRHFDTLFRLLMNHSLR